MYLDGSRHLPWHFFPSNFLPVAVEFAQTTPGLFCSVLAARSFLHNMCCLGAGRREVLERIRTYVRFWIRCVR